MTITIDKAGRVVIPASIRQEVGLEAGAELEVRVHADGSIQLVPNRTTLKLTKKGKRWVARPAVPSRELPRVDFDQLIEAERDRWPW